MGKRWSKLTGFHANHTRESLFGVFEAAVPVVQDSDAVPEFRLLSKGKGVGDERQEGLQGRILRKHTCGFGM